MALEVFLQLRGVCYAKETQFALSLRIGVTYGREEVRLSVQIIDDYGGLHPHARVGLRLLEVDEDGEALTGQEIVVHKARVLPRVLPADHDVLPGAAAVSLDQRETVLCEFEPERVRLEGHESSEGNEEQRGWNKEEQ